ncbi:hypothetical protein F3K40_36805, partial [Streptomyces sp. LBUM 1478]|nr:hypothetical protein [Streptomyces sp. LBUM 1478]
GRRVPQDVSVVGYDDIPEAAHLLPPLTTIRTDYSSIGTMALRLLLRQLDGRSRRRTSRSGTPSSPSS